MARPRGHRLAPLPHTRVATITAPRRLGTAVVGTPELGTVPEVVGMATISHRMVGTVVVPRREDTAVQALGLGVMVRRLLVDIRLRISSSNSGNSLRSNSLRSRRGKVL